MTGAGGCREIRLDLGVYLVGAIGSADRSAVEAHLSSCAACRNELAELACLPGLLRRITAADAKSLFRQDDDGCHDGIEPSADLRLHELLRRAARLRRQRVWPAR